MSLALTVSTPGANAMFERERTLYAFVLNYLQALSADIDDAQIADQPAVGMNHPAWILGHLAVCTDHAGKLLELPRKCAPEWHRLFGRGSKAEPDRARYPTKAELITVLAQGHERVAAAAANANPEAMRAPWPHVFKEQFPTVGDFLANLMTTHPCVHIGQLSAWRRLKGLPPLPEA
jgi:hypothetical protein